VQDSDDLFEPGEQVEGFKHHFCFCGNAVFDEPLALAMTRGNVISLSLWERWQPIGLTERVISMQTTLSLSVKNQRFLPAPPQGEREDIACKSPHPSRLTPCHLLLKEKALGAETDTG